MDTGKGILRRFQSTLPAGGATYRRERHVHITSISIHAPRRGSDSTAIKSNIANSIFQSTLPAGGATYHRAHRARKASISIHAPRRGSDVGGYCTTVDGSNFNPRSPQGERRDYLCNIIYGVYISIHAPRRGSDFRADPRYKYQIEFQSTLPAGGATIWMLDRL